jgi:hypothetical protein
MRCMECGSSAVSERPERTAQGYRRFRCRSCGKQSNERSLGQLNQIPYPSDVIALMVLWRTRSKLSLRDLAEMFLRPVSPPSRFGWQTGRPFHSVTIASSLRNPEGLHSLRWLWFRPRALV